MKYIIIAISIILFTKSYNMSAQNSELTKLYLSSEGNIYQLENHKIFNKTINNKVQIAHNSGVRSEKFDDRLNPLNFTISSKNKLIALYIDKPSDLLIFSKDQYWNSPWFIRYECKDLDKVTNSSDKPIIPSFKGLKLKGSVIFSPKDILYYDFVEFNHKMYLIITSGEYLHFFEANGDLCDAEWELCSSISLSKELGHFVSYVNESNRIVLLCSTGQEIELAPGLEKVLNSEFLRESGTLLFKGNRGYWLSEELTKLLLISEEPIEFFNKRIINNEK